jgi:hypothetical protein
MVTIPTLIDVAVTPRNEAVSGADALDVVVTEPPAVVLVTVGAVALFPLVPQAASEDADTAMTIAPTSRGARKRTILPLRRMKVPGV